MQSYTAKFDQKLWGKMKALSDLQNQKMGDWLSSAVLKNVDSISVKIYQENENYKTKRIEIKKKAHQKLKNKAYYADYTIRDIIQSIVEFELKEFKL
jgi:hypothetical protein